MSTFVKEITNAVDETEPVSAPFPNLRLNFDWSGETLVNKFPGAKNYKNIYKDNELGRQFISLESIKNSDYDLYEFWTNQLNNEETRILVEKLFDKLNAGYLNDYSKVRKYIYILLKKAINERLVDYISRRQSHAWAHINLKILSFLGYFNDGSYLTRKRVSKDSLIFDWTFVSDSKCSDHLKVHTDTAEKVLTLLIPLNVNEEKRRGTSLFSSKYNSVHWNSGRYEVELFNECFESKHLFGHAIAFGKTEKTWHGVQKGSNTLPRLTLILNCFKRKENLLENK